jgi:predicted PurR-regulated permease PerM
MESQCSPRPQWNGYRKPGWSDGIATQATPGKKSVAQVTEATGAIEKLASTNAEIKAVEVKRHPIAEMLFMSTPEFAASAVLSLILLYFLLVYDQTFIAKLDKVLPTLSDKKAAVGTAHDID